MGNPYSLVYFNDYLLWTDYRQGLIKSLSIHQRKQVEIVLRDDSPLYDFKFINFSKLEQLSQKNLCSTKQCQHLCLLQSRHEADCYCSDGYNLNNDLKSCQVSENYTKPSLCKKGEFECRNVSQCIDNRHVCDGDIDCLDGTDEDTSPGSICEMIECKPEYFRCDKTRCIMPHWVCDGQRDCLDGTDEMQFNNCTKVVCGPLFFKCNISGRCIPRTWVCDSDFDCGKGDFSDEHDQCGNLFIHYKIFDLNLFIFLQFKIILNAIL